MSRRLSKMQRGGPAANDLFRKSKLVYRAAIWYLTSPHAYSTLRFVFFLFFSFLFFFFKKKSFFSCSLSFSLPFLFFSFPHYFFLCPSLFDSFFLCSFFGVILEFRSLPSHLALAPLVRRARACVSISGPPRWLSAMREPQSTLIVCVSTGPHEMLAPSTSPGQRSGRSTRITCD